jgi:hypothetical protein
VASGGHGLFVLLWLLGLPLFVIAVGFVAVFLFRIDTNSSGART